MDLKIGTRMSINLAAIGWVKAIIDNPLTLFLNDKNTPGFLFRIYEGKFEGGIFWQSTVNILSGLYGPKGYVEFIAVMNQSQVTELRVNKKLNAFILSCSLRHGMKILSLDEKNNPAVFVEVVKDDNAGGG